MADKLKTKEEAEEALKIETAKMPDWFCPLINRTCREECVCFSHAQMYERGNLTVNDSKYKVTKNSCDNGMFSDVRYVEN